MLPIEVFNFDSKLADGMPETGRLGVHDCWRYRLSFRRLSRSVVVCTPPHGYSSDGQADHHDPSNVEAQETEVIAKMAGGVRLSNGYAAHSNRSTAASP
jgi:hypothetical protein